MWLAQAWSFLNFLEWAFAPKLNELIWSFNLQPLFPCQWLPDQVTLMIRGLELMSRPRARPLHYQVAEMALKRQRHLIASPPICHPSPWQDSKFLTTLASGIVWKFKWSQLKMVELHLHPHMPGRHQWWRTCSEMVSLVLPKPLWQAPVGPSYFMEGDL